MPPHLARALHRESTRCVPWYTGVDAADLRQEGLIAWWQTSQAYDATRGVPLPGYAWPRVLGRVQDVQRQVTSRGRRRYVPLVRAPAVRPREREVWLWRRVNRLPRRLRFVVIRVYWSGWRQQSIAGALGVSVRRVYHLQRQALRQLRLALVLDLLECG